MLQGLAKESLLPEFVLEVDSIHDVPPSRGEQIIPNFRRPGGALGEPFMKERALLQVLPSPQSCPLFILFKKGYCSYLFLKNEDSHYQGII